MHNSDVVRHLESDYTEPVRDPLWSHIHLSPALRRVTETPPFRQLSRIRQLGPTYLVYPGATHTRLSHSLGVFHLARRLLIRLTRHPACPPISLEGAKAYLAAALLHDVGHFPYTHSFKSLPLAAHEALTGRHVCSGSLAERLRDDLGVDPEVVAAIVDEGRPDGADREIRLFRRLLSGSLDPDKLDYLNRDAYFCGVPYGLQDIDFALSRIVPDGYEGIGLDERGVTAVENILFSKYLMYRAVYWHRTVRVATAMIKKSVGLALEEGVIRPEDLYDLDDETLLARYATHRFSPFALIAGVAASMLYVPVAEAPFDPAIAGHTRLGNGSARARAEADLASSLSAAAGRRLAPYEIILDLPDPISFEADFPIFVNGERAPFDAQSVFNADVVRTFSERLRRFRLIVPPEVADRLSDPSRVLAEVLGG